MQTQGLDLRSRCLFRCAFSGAFLFAILTQAAWAALPSVVLTQLPGGLSAPVHVTNAHDGSGRLFIVEQPGTIRIFKNGAFLATPFLDISALASYDAGERGLLSVAFHPDYSSNGYFYVYYTDKSSPVYKLTIARYHVSANPDVADPASAQIVLGVPHPTNTNHNGGQLFFGPGDGYLYMGTGDGGSGGDPPNNAQNLDVLLGKLLRLDVDGTGAVPCGQATPMPYAIPASNPFVGMAGCDEIWAYGLRNPWRFSFDRMTSDLLIGDVGQNLYEEIDFQPAASTGSENYGWRKMEGLHCYDPAPCNDGTLTLPILEETHNPGGWCAIIGGYRYRGTAIPGLAGVYLYGDTCKGQVWAATEAGGSWTKQLLVDPSLQITSFGEDEGGEVYVADLGGAVYRIDPIDNPAPAISSLSPTSVIAGDPAFTLTVNGSGFVDGSVVRWNGSDRPTTFVGAGQLKAAIAAGDIGAVGAAPVTVFTPAPGGGLSGPKTFNVNLTFLDVATTDFGYVYIQAVANAGVTAGCDTRLFCPGSPTSRAQMAVFLLKSSLGSGHVPPGATGLIFTDVHPGDYFADWIEDLAGRGVTGGCGGGKYCPDRDVSRAEMAVLLLKTSLGTAHVPPTATGLVFKDVHPGDFAADWIEDLAARNITGGCDAAPNYCPDRPVSRAEMAVFLTRTFNLPLP
jgi:glucose/arabinose dehydrogenase